MFTTWPTQHPINRQPEKQILTNILNRSSKMALTDIVSLFLAPIQLCSIYIYREREILFLALFPQNVSCIIISAENNWISGWRSLNCISTRNVTFLNLILLFELLFELNAILFIPAAAPRRWCRRRGLRSGLLVRLRLLAYLHHFQVLPNHQSLDNKVDGLRARISV